MCITEVFIFNRSYAEETLASGPSPKSFVCTQSLRNQQMAKASAGWVHYGVLSRCGLFHLTMFPWEQLSDVLFLFVFILTAAASMCSLPSVITMDDKMDTWGEYFRWTLPNDTIPNKNKKLLSLIIRYLHKANTHVFTISPDIKRS